MKHENLYQFIFWYNPYEDLWYAIDRNTQLDFFNGNRDASVYFKSKEIKTLIEIVGNKKLLHKMISQDIEEKNN
jgi:hypothetical protein